MKTRNLKLELRTEPSLHHSKNFAVALASIAAIAGCGANGLTTRDDSTEQGGVGTEVARVEIGGGKTARFVEYPHLGVLFMETGPAGATFVDHEAIVGKPADEIYRTLSGKEPPQQLVEAVKRAAVDEHAGPTPEAPPGQPDHGPAKTLPPGSAPGGASSPEGAPSRRPQDFWSDDANWFRSTWCALSDEWGASYAWDDQWCTTEFWQWVHSGWGPSSRYYQAASATTDSTANLWIEYWNGSSWVRLANASLNTWSDAWLYWTGRSVQFRSGVDGGNARIYFVDESRNAMPHIGGHIIDYPDNRTYENFSANLNGITHNQTNWFLTRDDRWGVFGSGGSDWGWIAKQDITNPIADPSPRVRMPQSWHDAGIRHFGDLTWATDDNGREILVVAMDDDSGYGQAAGVFDTNLNPIGFKFLDSYPGDRSNPFLAFDPRNRRFYAMPNTTTLVRYAIHVSGSTITTQLEKTIPIASYHGAHVICGDCWVQGGKISSNGNLYVSIGGAAKEFGIYMIDPNDGNIQDWFGIDPGASDEFEGIDLLDLSGSSLGQIHIMQVDAGVLSGDDYWLAHYPVDDPSRL